MISSHHYYHIIFFTDRRLDHFFAVPILEHIHLPHRIILEFPDVSVKCENITYLKSFCPIHWTETIITMHWLVNWLKYSAEESFQIFHHSLSESTTTAFLSTDKNIFLWIFYIVSLLLQKRNDVNRNGWHSLTLFHKYVKAVVEKIYIFLKKKVFPKSKS